MPGTGLLIVDDDWAGVADGADVNGRSPNLVNVNSVSWVANANAWQGTATAGEIQSNTGNFLLSIDTKTTHWFAEIDLIGQSTDIANTLMPRLFGGADGDSNFFNVGGYAFHAPNNTALGLRQLRLTRVNDGSSDNTIQTDTNALDIWPDATVELEWDDTGADPVVTCTVTRGMAVETLTFTDTDASKKTGVLQQFFGAMNGRIGRVRIWDENQSGGAPFKPYRMLMS